MLDHTSDVLSVLSTLACSRTPPFITTTNCTLTIHYGGLVLVIVRIYAIWGRSWGTVIIVAPLSLAEPALRIVSPSRQLIMIESLMYAS